LSRRLEENLKMSQLACIDLFCGAGGLTHGLISEGVPVVAGIDIDEACRYPIENNNSSTRFLKEDVSLLTPRKLDTLFGDAEIRILAGCAPCQPFSSYAHRYDTKGSPRWRLLIEFARLIKGVKPDVVTMENVPTVTNHAVFEHFVTTLKRLGYGDPWVDVIDCAYYGLPQRRRRIVLLASRIGSIELIKAPRNQLMTVREAIGTLAPIEAGCVDTEDSLHLASHLSELNLKRIRASRPGGTWRNWPKPLIAECHLRDSGRTYPSVYGRMVWDAPAPTLTTQFFGFGNGRFGHPEQDRAISLREGAILQGFSRSYSFVPEGKPINIKALGRLIGNAVPVTLGRVIGHSIMAHLGIEPSLPANTLSHKKTEGFASWSP
jgi:DNA (cytosine-5)-methyltransferase 1